MSCWSIYIHTWEDKWDRWKPKILVMWNNSYHLLYLGLDCRNLGCYIYLILHRVFESVKVMRFSQTGIKSTVSWNQYSITIFAVSTWLYNHLLTMMNKVSKLVVYTNKVLQFRKCVEIISFHLQPKLTYSTLTLTAGLNKNSILLVYHIQINIVPVTESLQGSNNVITGEKIITKNQSQCSETSQPYKYKPTQSALTYLPYTCATRLQPYVSKWHGVWAPSFPIHMVETDPPLSGKPKCFHDTVCYGIHELIHSF